MRSLANSTNRPKLLLPWFSNEENYIRDRILDTLEQIIQRTSLERYLTRINVNIDSEELNGPVKVLVYRLFFAFGAEEYWVESHFASDGRYWWISSSNKIGVGSTFESNLTISWENQIEITIEALRRFLKESEEEKSREAGKLVNQLNILNHQASLIRSLNQGLPRTFLSH